MHRLLPLVLLFSCVGADDSAEADTDTDTDTEDCGLGLCARPANVTCFGLTPPGSGEGTEVAAVLSQTGCVDPDDPTQPADFLVPYDLIAPLWSDGAVKQRQVGVPDGQTVGFDGNGDLDFPIGTVIVKWFNLQGTLIETRLLVRHDDGNWAGYSYKWRSDGTDADLLDDVDYVQVGEQWWTYPGPFDCLYCHSEAAGRSLGPEIAQLDRDLAYPSGVTSNQVEVWEHIGLFADPPPSVPVLSAPSGEGDLEARARSYLHSNCSHCHRPGGPAGNDMDLRYYVPLADAQICDVVPNNTGGITDARRLAPGDPDRSIIAVRMADEGWRMPPIGTNEIDDDAVQLVRDWIELMTECPGN